MNVISCSIEDVKQISPKVFSDNRGYFMESFNSRNLMQALNENLQFVQDNQSYSKGPVLRGLHYQLNHPQGKLIRVLDGEIFDVAVDLRRHSKSYAKWVGVTLSSNSFNQLWIPIGFAHGFLVTSEEATILYKTTDYYHPEDEFCIRYDDKKLAIDWPTTDSPMISEKDKIGLDFSQAPKF